MEFKDLSLLDVYPSLQSESIYNQFKIDPDDFPKLREKIFEIQINSFLPVLALFGQKANPSDHIPFINFAATCPAGHVLSIQASVARQKPETWLRFSHSLRQKGFVFAWLKYAGIVGLPAEISNTEKTLDFAFESPDLTDPESRTVAESARANLPLPGSEEFLELLKQAAKRLEAERKRVSRGLPKKSPSTYKSIVRTRLLAHSLWCRPTTDFAGDYFLSSMSDELTKHERAFNKAFSELGLTKIRRTDIPEERAPN